jgi:hypothetical protein
MMGFHSADDGMLWFLVATAGAIVGVFGLLIHYTVSSHNQRYKALEDERADRARGAVLVRICSGGRHPARIYKLRDGTYNEGLDYAKPVIGPEVCK